MTILMNGEPDEESYIPSFLGRLLETPWMGSLVIDGSSRIILINRALAAHLGVEVESVIGKPVTTVLGCDEDAWSSVIEEGEGLLRLGASDDGEVETRSYTCDEEATRRCVVFDTMKRLRSTLECETLWERLGIGGIRWRVGTTDTIVDNLRIDHPSYGMIRISLDTVNGSLSIRDSEGKDLFVDDDQLQEFTKLFSHLAAPTIIRSLEMQKKDEMAEVNEFFAGIIGGQDIWLETSLTMDEEGIWAEGLVRQLPKSLREGINASRTVSDYHTVMDIIPSALCIIQGDEVVYINEGMSSFLERDHADIMGHTFFELIHPDDRETVIERYRSRMAGGNPPSEYSIKMMGGAGVIHARINSTIINWRGAPAALVIVDDVSEYIRIEERLKEDERLKRSILNSFPNPVILSSPDGHLIWSNIAARKKLDIGDEDIECHQLISPDVEFDSKTFWEGVEKEGSRVLEDILLRDGRRYRVTGQAVFEKGELSGIVHDMRDITEEIEATKAAVRARERLDAASKALGFSNLTYTYGTKHLTIDNMPREVIVPDEQGRVGIKELEKSIHHEDLQSILNILNPDTLQTGIMKDLTFRGMFRRGPYRWYRLLVTKLGEGEESYISGAVFDVHELRSNQLSLKIANKKLGLLAGITGHDIRNQLTALSGYSEILLDRLEPEERRKDRGILEKMMIAMDNIKEQLEFARDYQDLGLEEPRWVDVGKKVEEFKASPSFSHLDIINDSKGIMLFADPLFKKVLFNLFDNSIRHGGNVKSIRVYSPGHGSVVVEDDGVGIEPSLKKRVFDRDMGMNTGLGMFLTKEILSMTGITIREDGEHGQGARFILEAPRDRFQDLKVRNGQAL